MEKRTKVILTFAAAVLLVAFLYSFSDWFSKTTGYLIEEDPNSDLAKCLSEKGVKLYGSKKCPDCREQKKIFGDKAFQYINYIECSTSPIDCNNIRSVPAWKIKNDFYYGIKTLDELRYLAQCY